MKIKSQSDLLCRKKIKGSILEIGQVEMRLSLIIFCLSSNRAISTPTLWVSCACSALQVSRARVSYLILTWLEVVSIISTDAPYLSDLQHEKRLLSGSDEGERMDGRKNKALVISSSLFLPAEAFRELFLCMTFPLLRFIRLLK